MPRRPKMRKHLQQCHDVGRQAREKKARWEHERRRRIEMGLGLPRRTEETGYSGYVVPHANVPCQCPVGDECAIAAGRKLKEGFFCRIADELTEENSIEKEIEDKCTQYAYDRGFISYKMQTAGVRGWPDRSFYGPNKIHFLVEFKQPGKKPTKQQIERIEELVDRGHDVWVIDSVDDFKKALDAELGPWL